MSHGSKAFPGIHVWMYMCKHLSQCIQKAESFPLHKKKPRWIFMRKHHILPRTNEQLRVSQQNSQREFWQKCSWFVSCCAPLMCQRHIPFESLASKCLQLLQNIFYVCCGVPVLLLLSEVSINRQTCFLFFITALLLLTVLCLFLACSGISAPHLGLW